MADRPQNFGKIMEATTPFDLNRAIQQWRENLEPLPAFRQGNLDELETHLRDSVAALQARGLSAEEAFFVAARRAGSSAALGAEFGKVNTRGIWLDRVLWMLVGNLFFWTASGLLSFVSSSLIFLGLRKFGFPYGYPYIALFFIFIHLLTFAATLAVCWRLVMHNWVPTTKWLAKSSRSSARLAVVAAIGIVGILLARLVQASSSALLLSYTSPAEYGWFTAGQSLGNLIASLIESAAFVILALWLARRRLLAKA